jgi:hypothetical protein
MSEMEPLPNKSSGTIAGTSAAGAEREAWHLSPAARSPAVRVSGLPARSLVVEDAKTVEQFEGSQIARGALLVLV